LIRLGGFAAIETGPPLAATQGRNVVGVLSAASRFEARRNSHPSCHASAFFFCSSRVLWGRPW
jgi:hypothetical protein